MSEPRASSDKTAPDRSHARQIQPWWTSKKAIMESWRAGRARLAREEKKRTRGEGGIEKETGGRMEDSRRMDGRVSPAG